MAKGPKAPDPTQTSNQQLSFNKEAGTAQQETNMVNQTTPFGSLNYSQTGTNPDGTPIFQATQSYSPEVQSAFDGLIGQINGQAGDPTARQMALYEKYYQPLIDQSNRALDTKLMNQGITPGSQAYNNAQNLQARNVGDQQTNWLLNSTQLANQPFEQLASLRSGASPGFAQTPTVSIQPPNFQDATQQQYAQKVAQANAFNSAIGQAVGAVGGGWARGRFAGI